MFTTKKLTKDQALQKLKYYCSYQERCHKEAKEKLYSYGLYKGDVEEVIAKLIEDEYLNEERFARQFAGGKFRMRQWGRNKIVYELKQKNVSAYCIKLALKEIDEPEYLSCLQKLITQKWAQLKDEPVLIKRTKTYAYLNQKGFESELVQQVLNETESSLKSKQ